MLSSEDVPFVRLAVLVALAAAVLVAGPALGQGDAHRTQATITSASPVAVGGQVDASARGGLGADLADDGVVTAEADRIVVVTEWDKGVLVEDPSGTVKTAYSESKGRTVQTLEDAEVEFGPRVPSSPSPLLVPPSSDATIEASSFGEVTGVGVAEGETLAEGGVSSSTQDQYDQEGEPPYYEAKAPEPLVSLEGLEQAEATGPLEVFPYNATIDVRGAEDRLETWSGLRTSDGPGPTEYELRVVVLYLDGGRLQVSDGGDVTLYAGNAHVNLSGSLGTDDARGTLDVGEATVEVDGGPVHLSGDGNLDLRPSAEAGDETPSLEARIDGNFQVARPSSVDTTAKAPSTSQGLGPTLPLAGAAAAALLAAALLLAGRGNPWFVGLLPAPVRARLYDRWKTKARRSEEAGDRARAAAYYEKMARLRPRQPLGWYGSALNRLEGGDPETALESLRRAREKLETVPPDLLEIEVAAAVGDGRQDVARSGLRDLADASPHRAETLVEALGLEDGLGAADGHDAGRYAGG